MKAEPLDNKIVKCLEEGLFYEALSGKGAYFIFDPFYRGEHDKLLVVSTIVRWAKAFNKIEYAKEKLLSAAKDILEADLFAGLDVVNCYLIVRRDTKISLDINLEELLPSAIKGLNNADALTTETAKRINSLLITISTQVIAFTKILELWNKKTVTRNAPRPK